MGRVPPTRGRKAETSPPRPTRTTRSSESHSPEKSRGNARSPSPKKAAAAAKPAGSATPKRAAAAPRTPKKASPPQSQAVAKRQAPAVRLPANTKPGTPKKAQTATTTSTKQLAPKQDKFKSKEMLDSTSDSEADSEDDDGPGPVPKHSSTLVPPTPQSQNNKLTQQASLEHQPKSGSDSSGSDEDEDNSDDDDFQSRPQSKTPVKSDPIKTQKSPSPSKDERKQSSSQNKSAPVTKGRKVKADEIYSETDDDEQEADQSTLTSRPRPPKKEKEQQQEAADVDLAEGMMIFGSMNSEAINELLERIGKQCSLLDRIPAKRKEKSVDWEQVSFSSYTPKQCEAVWQFLRNHTRAYRILSEVVEEVKYKYASDKQYHAKIFEKIPGYPQKPASAKSGFYYYNRQEWEQLPHHADEKLERVNFVSFQRKCRMKYDALPNEEKQKYEELSREEMIDYKRKVKQFLAKNPELAKKIETQAGSSKTLKNRTRATSSGDKPARVRLPKKESSTSRYEDAPKPPSSPIVTFVEEKLSRVDPPPRTEDVSALKHKFVNKWKSMSDRKRAVWVEACITKYSHYLENAKEYQETHPGYKFTNISHIIPKDDLAVWEAFRGKPSNPKTIAFELFYDQVAVMEDYAHLSEEDRKRKAHSAFAELNADDKTMISCQLKISKVHYRKEMQNFFSTIPDFMKPVCLKTVPKLFHKALEEIDKVPEGAAEVGGMIVDEDDTVVKNQEESYEQLELPNPDESDEAARKRRKKERKEKRRRDRELYRQQEALTVFHDERDPSEINESNYVTYQNNIDSENFDTDTQPPRKKAKKSKKTADSEYSQYQDQANYNEDYYDNNDEYGGPGTSNIRQQAQAQKQAKSSLQKVKNYGEKSVFSIGSEEGQTAKNYPSNNKVTKNDIFEATRGIFDARAHLGRRFTPYYYYAKFVATEKYWIDSVVDIGVEETASNIIKTFLNLPDIQKDNFLSWSIRFKKEGRHRIVSLTDRGLFPGEPKPPPRRAWQLYLYDKRKGLASSKNTSEEPTANTWFELSDNVQIYYIKKLYHETRTYMKNYDKFIASMTPSDLVHYAVYRAEKWEDTLYSKQAISQACKQFTFNFSNYEDEDDTGLDSDPEIVDPLGSQSITSNPFAHGDNLVRNIIKNMAKTNKRKKTATNNVSEGDSDDALDDYYKQGFQYLAALPEKIRRKQRKEQMAREKERYQGILEFIKPEEEHCSSCGRNNLATLNMATQTTYGIGMKRIGVQTIIGGLGATGKIIVAKSNKLTEEDKQKRELEKYMGKLSKLILTQKVPKTRRKRSSRKTAPNPKIPMISAKSSDVIPTQSSSSNLSNKIVTENVMEDERSQSYGQTNVPLTDPLLDYDIFAEPLTPVMVVEHSDINLVQESSNNDMNLTDLTNVPFIPNANI